MATVTGVLQPPAGYGAPVTLTSWAGDATFPVTPTAGMQMLGPSALTIGADGTVTGPDGNYSLTLIDGAGSGTAYSVAYTIESAGEPPADPSNVTVTGILQAPAGWQIITLPSGYSEAVFTHAEGEPFEFEATDKTGWQFGIEADPLDVELTLSGTDIVLTIPGVDDGSGGLTRPAGIDLLDAVLIDPTGAGTAHGIQVSTTDIVVYGSSAETPSSENWPFSKLIKPKAQVAWTWGARHPLTGMRVRKFNG